MCNATISGKCAAQVPTKEASKLHWCDSAFIRLARGATRYPHQYPDIRSDEPAPSALLANSAPPTIKAFQLNTSAIVDHGERAADVGFASAKDNVIKLGYLSRGREA
jgi:hypothetical protein